MSLSFIRQAAEKRWPMPGTGSQHMLASSSLTEKLQQLTEGDRSAADALFPLVYRELHELARRQLRNERSNHTLCPTALVNEAYLKLVDQEHTSWKNRSHFLAICSLAMRRILVDYANRRLAAKRGAGAVRVTYDDIHYQSGADAEQIIALEDALRRLERHNRRHAVIISYSFFGGLTHSEIAEALHVSIPTVRREWRFARAWLSVQLGGPQTAGGASD